MQRGQGNIGHSPTRSVQQWFCSSARTGSPCFCPGPRRSNTGGRCLWGDEGWGEGLPPLQGRETGTSFPPLCMEWGAPSSAQEPQTRGPAHGGALPSLPKALSQCHAPEREGHQAGGGQGASQWPHPRSDEWWVHPWPGRLCPWGKAPAPGDSSPRAGRVEAEVHTPQRQQTACSLPACRLHRCLEPLLPFASSPPPPPSWPLLPPSSSHPQGPAPPALPRAHSSLTRLQGQVSSKQGEEESLHDGGHGRAEPGRL